MKAWFSSTAAVAPYFTGTVRDAASASRADVQSAIDAASDLDVVRLPSASSATWTSTVTCSKAIKINLNGCTITRNIGDSTTLFSITPVAAKKVRLTNGILAGGSTGSGFGGRYVSIGDSDTGRFRIDNISFGSASGWINIKVNAAYGVIDNCTFTDSSPNEIIHCEAWGPSDATGWGDDLLGGGAAYGDAQVFIEDNDFQWTGGDNAAHAVLQCYYGARVTFRYNDVRGIVDVHGNTPRKGRWIEVYNNTWRCANNLSRMLQLRGGSGIVYNNVLRNESGAAGSRNIYLWLDSGSSYPTQDQIGRGKDQALDPMYIWGNSVVNDGGGTTGWDIGIDEPGTGGPYIVEDRDYYLTSKGTWSAYTYPNPLQSGTD